LNAETQRSLRRKEFITSSLRSLRSLRLCVPSFWGRLAGHVWLVLAVACLAASGCARDSERTVTVYSSVDETFGREVLAKYKSRTGVRVDVIFDSEAGKTTGLIQRIRLERDRPRADVFWSSELFGTILLAREGLLAPYDPPAASDIPPRYRDAEHRWTAFGLRGRVLAFDPARIQVQEVPTTWQSVAEPGAAAKLAFANPLFGTTRGHVAAMFALWGPERATAWLKELRANGARMVDGNSTAVRELAQGHVALAATDTDDVRVANRKGARLEMAYPDLGDGGTLLIPNSVAVLTGAPNPQAAQALVDYLVSAEVEEMLARSDSGNVPVRGPLREKLGLALPPESKVPYEAVADAMDEAVAAVREILVR